MNIIIYCLFLFAVSEGSNGFPAHDIPSCSLLYTIPLQKSTEDTILSYDFFPSNNDECKDSSIYLIIERNVGHYAQTVETMIEKLTTAGVQEWKIFVPYGIRSDHMITLADVNNDSVNDVVFIHYGKISTDSNAVIFTVINGHSGEIIVQYNTPLTTQTWDYLINCSSDLNGDGLKDAVCYDWDSLIVFETMTGKLLWKRDMLTKNELRELFLFDILLANPRRLLVSDVNADGKIEIIFSWGLYIYCLDGMSGKTLWHFDTRDSYFNSDPLFLDDRQDSGKIIIAGTAVWNYEDKNLNIHAVNAKNGIEKWTFMTQITGMRNEVQLNNVEYNDKSILLYYCKQSDLFGLIHGNPKDVFERSTAPYNIDKVLVCEMKNGNMDVLAVIIDSIGLKNAQKILNVCKFQWVPNASGDDTGKIKTDQKLHDNYLLDKFQLRNITSYANIPIIGKTKYQVHVVRGGLFIFILSDMDRTILNVYYCRL